MAVNLTARILSKASLIFANKAEVIAATELDVQNRRMGRDFIREITMYPPEGPGNKPPAPYWERGTGRVHASGKVNPPSQNFKDSWQLNGFKTPFGGQVKVSTVVTYSPYLVDDTKQAWFHKKNGWRTVGAVAQLVGIRTQQQGAGNFAVSDGGGYLQAAQNKIETALRNIFLK